ncbi:MAG TPA: response regulator [Trebonia sp.]
MQSSAHPVSSASGRGGQRAPGTRGRVLLVEDDPEAALFAVYALKNRGRFEVVHTPDPAVALALAATEPWDLALTDLDLPLMSGAELIAALRRIAPHLPVILVTGDAQDAFAAAGRCRPDDVLVKPVSAERLLAAAIALAGRRDPSGQAPNPNDPNPPGRQRL